MLASDTEPSPKKQKVDSTADEPTESTTSHPLLQINPTQVDTIITHIISKRDWFHKLHTLSNAWKNECKNKYRKTMSLATIDTAFEILHDMALSGRGAKTCCGHCGAHPMPWKDRQLGLNYDTEKHDPTYILCRQDIQSDEDEYYTLDNGNPVYGRDERFCLCPCKHCALKPKSVLLNNVSEVSIRDCYIPNELKMKLKQEMEWFETVPEKDWHPGSNGQVLDLIHPSLYCYVEGKSVVLDGFETQKQPIGFSESGNKYEGANCQWLPAEFKVEKPTNGNIPKVEIQSYINNINQYKNKGMYEAISKIFGYFAPLFQQHIGEGLYEQPLQVIVKAANIIVTPDKPYYMGGSWHREGLPHEHIVATGIYYYQSENVKDSFLEFRESISDPYEYEQNDVRGAFDEYGLHDGDLQFSHLGYVETKEDRCLVFSNEPQHRVRHFFPIDPLKPAVRKILVFFLVDPTKKIVSTRNVQVQRMDYLLDNYLSLVKKMPFHILFNNIMVFIPHFTLREAKANREALMSQRKFYKDEDNVEFEREFSLCEH